MATAESNSPNPDTQTTSRETRRRRIVDRGNDRFALITGRIQSLPSPSEPNHSRSSTCPPSISEENHYRLQPSDLPVHDSLKSEDVGSAHLSNHDSVSESSTQSIVEGPLTRKCETSIGASNVPDLDYNSSDQSSKVPSTILDPSGSKTDVKDNYQPRTRQFQFWNPTEISSAVTKTESIRVYCALAAAILVVLIHAGFPVIDDYMLNKVLFFRPLYSLLLTNISIVAAQVLSEKQRGSERTGQRERNVPSGGGFGRLGDALETGLVLQKVTGALFMDCSIYLVVVVCGLSIAKGLGC